MFKLRFQIALPIAQLLLAGALIESGRRGFRPSGLDFPYPPTSVLICNGISAPAMMFSVGASLLLPGEPDRTAVSVLGFGAKELFFLLGVIFVWFFVGRLIDRRHGVPASGRHAKSIAKPVLDMALMLLSILVLLLGAAPLFYSRGFANPTGAKAASVLWFAWFFVLFFLPGIDLVRHVRTKR